MARKVLLKVRRGIKASLPVLDDGEMGFCTDTSELYIGTKNGNVVTNQHLTYTTTTQAAEAYYRVAQIPINSNFKTALFKVKAYTASGTVTESLVTVDIGYNAANYGSQGTSVTTNTSHSFNSWTNVENGYVLLYCRVSFDANFAYIDFYKYKTTAATIEIEPLIKSDWVFSTGALTANPAIGALRNVTVSMSNGLSGNSINATSASYSTYSQYGVLGTQTISNTTNKTGQWVSLGHFYIAYNSSYARGHSGNIRIRLQEANYDGSKDPSKLEDFVIRFGVNVPYHADSTAFINTVPKISIQIEGDTTLSQTDIAAVVSVSNASYKHVYLYVKLNEANKTYNINPEQRYGRSFATSAYTQTTSYCYYNMQGDVSPVVSLPTPVQGSVVYGVKKSVDADSIGGKVVNDSTTDNNSLWTARKIVDYVAANSGGGGFKSTKTHITYQTTIIDVSNIGNLPSDPEYIRVYMGSYDNWTLKTVAAGDYTISGNKITMKRSLTGLYTKVEFDDGGTRMAYKEMVAYEPWQINIGNAGTFPSDYTLINVYDTWNNGTTWNKLPRDMDWTVIDNKTVEFWVDYYESGMLGKVTWIEGMVKQTPIYDALFYMDF